MTQRPARNHVCGIRYHNTLHGIQYLGNDQDDGTRGYVACSYIDLNPEQRLAEQLHAGALQIAGIWDGIGSAPTDRVWTDSFLGLDYFAVRNRSDAPAIINALLALNCRVQVRTKLPIAYSPEDAPFSIETSERLLLAGLRRVNLGRDGITAFGTLRPEIVLDERLWKTEAGKEFAREQLRLTPWAREKYELDAPLWVPFDPSSPFDPVMDWPPPPPPEKSAPVPKQSPPPPLPAAVAVELKRNNPEPDEESIDCIVCMVNKANTMVLPCEHIVACKACSDKLRDTPNAHKCILCRRPITMVMEDGQA